MTPTRPDRYHALDALRGFAMLLGILLHAAIPYLHTKFPAWPVQDAHRSVFFDVNLLAIHDFRMQLFFLLAGFFGALLYARYGALGTIAHRFKRITLPLGLAMVTVIPVLQAVSAYAAATVYVVDPSAAPGGEKFKEVLSAADTPGGVVVHFFATGNFMHYLVPAHLWFLWYLLLCFTVMLPLAMFADRLKDAAVVRAGDRFAGWLFTSRWRWLIFTAVTWPVMLLMKDAGVPDTPLDWQPLWHLLGYYFLFFGIGWTLYRHRDKLVRFAGGWFAWLLVAILVVLPTGLVLFDLRQNPEEAGLTKTELLRYPINAVLVLFTWLMIGGLIGLFLRYLSGERAWVRWLADSAYWCYLVSLPPVIVLQFLIASWDVPAAIKFVVVTAGTMTVVLATYRFFVRYMWIGRLLNGPRGHAVNRDATAEHIMRSLPATLSQRPEVPA